jgi:DNA-binding NarL/FixJ family response regulator
MASQPAHPAKGVPPAPRDGCRRVLVVDDHLTFAELLVRALDGEPDLQCVGHAQSAQEARRLVADLEPDLVLADVRLGPGGEDGISLTSALTTAHPDVRVVILTAYADGDLVRRAAAAGASGIVPKDGSLSEMLDVLRRARSASLVLHPELLNSLLSPPAREPAAAASTLTSREQQVLELLAQGLDARAIARRLGISVNTCRGYVKTLLTKLDAHTQLEAVVTATRRGLIRFGAP